MISFLMVRLVILRLMSKVSFLLALMVLISPSALIVRSIAMSQKSDARFERL